MSTQAIDYDALAQQHGAAPAPVDYDALASQHGAVEAPKETSIPILAGYQRAGRILKEAGKDLLGSIGGMAEMASSAGNPGAQLKSGAALMNRYMDAYQGAKEAAQRGDTTESMFKSVATPFAPLGIDEIYDDAKAGKNDAAIGKGLSRISQLAAPEVLPRVMPETMPKIPLPDSGDLAAKARAVGSMAGREVTGRVPILNRFEQFRKPTFNEWLDAFNAKADPQLELFKNTPKVGDFTPSQQQTIATAESQAKAVPSGEAPVSSGPSTVPRVASGEGVLNQALTSLDNKSLIKVARSRGINVTQEAQLKPGAANSRIISKIIDDFTPEELDEIRNMGMEISRNVPVQNPNVTPEAAAEAWHYKVLNQFFPDVAVPKTMAARAQATIANRPMSPREQAFYAQAASEAKAVPSDAPQYAYRVRDAGETGITPKGSHAQATLDQAQATNPDFIQGRQAAQNHPQEVVRVDLSKLDPKDYEIIKQNGQQWVKFKSSVPEAVIEKMPAQSTQDWSIENMQKQIMLNRFKAKAAKAGD